MSAKKCAVAIASVVVLGLAWYLFRPELLFIDQEVNESFPQAAANAAKERVLAQGSFKTGAHETKGTATVHELGDGRRVLRLSGFATSNGPDLRVILVDAADLTEVPGTDTVKKAGYVEVAKLKGNLGDQNYELPAGVDLARHRAVTIWCNRFSVNFGTAALSRVN